MMNQESTAVPGTADNSAQSSWVSFTNVSSSAPAGVYVYRLTFDLPCTNGASINGRFMADDTARIVLNGTPTAATPTSDATKAPADGATRAPPAMRLRSPTTLTSSRARTGSRRMVARTTLSASRTQRGRSAAAGPGAHSGVSGTGSRIVVSGTPARAGALETAFQVPAVSEFLDCRM